MVALDTLMGTDESLGFEDFLNGNFRYYSKIVFKSFPNKLQYFFTLKMVFHILLTTFYRICRKSHLKKN